MNEKLKKAYTELRNYAFYLNKYTPDDAEDLLQDTILKMIEKIDMYTDNTKSLTSWGFTIMHNLHINKLRLKKNFVPEDILQRIPDVVIEKDTLLKRTQLKLKDKKNLLEIFILRKFGLSYNEISNLLQVPLTTTKIRMHYMKKYLCENSNSHDVL